MKTVHFAKPGKLHGVLRNRTSDRLDKAGVPRHGGLRIILKTLVILTLLVGSYVGLVFYASEAWHALLLGFLLAHALVLVGFNIMHDGGHGAYSNKKWVNRLAGRALDLIGGNQTLWRYKHGVLHHTYTNLSELDDDLDGGTLIRMHRDQPHRPWHRFQAYYALPVYSLLAIHWVVSDFSEYFGGKVGGHELKTKRDPADIAIFLGFKVLFFLLSFVIPMTRHEPWVVLVTWTAIMLVVGFFLALVFQLAHVVDGVEFPEPLADPEGGPARLQDEWVFHQLKTTADFAPNSRFLRWYTGGLNYQVEHHLFPRTSHVRYPLLQPVVKQTCEEFGAPYHCYPTLMSAVRAHVRQLHSLGKNPAEEEVLAGASAS
ncbi:MAG: acyl-CoA desaturase [Myxococcota bacterium]